MEWILYYSYLKFRKDNMESIPRRLVQLPALVIVLLCLLCISTIAGLIVSLIATIKIFAWIPIGIESICCIILYFYTENYQIRMSDVKLEEYRAYCEEVYKWLESCCISSKEEIQDIKNRLLSYIVRTETDRKYKKESVDKWLQVLVIPVILAVLSVLINQQAGIEYALSYAFSIIFVFLLIYGAIWGVRRVKYFFSERKLDQIQYFADDLQGVLDTQFKVGREEIKHG